MDENRKHGAREAPRVSLWQQYKMWLAGLSRGQLIRYRALQVAVALSLVVIVGYAALSAWIRLPDVPDVVPGEQGSGDSSGALSFEGAEAPDQVPANGRKPGVYTFLVAGRDVASGATDTMLLLTYDIQTRTIHGLNLPRDTMINVSTASKRLNAVYTYNRGKDKQTQAENGMAALKDWTARLTGIKPDFYVLIEWEAVGKLVDAIGGVEFEVPFDMDYDDPYQDLHIHQKAGLRLLNGDDAMQVIRHRKNNDGSHSNGDVARLTIQQDFLKATAKKCLQPATLLKLPELVNVFKENVSTDLTVGNILAFAQSAVGMDPESGVSFQTAPIAASFLFRSASMVTLDYEELLEIVNSQMNPYLEDIKVEALEHLYRKADGSFGVTRGTLADAGFAQPYVPPAQTDPEEEPEENLEEPGEGEPMGGEQPGEQSPEENPNPPGGEDEPQTQPGDEEPGSPGEEPGGEENPGEAPGTIDPEQVFPDPDRQENSGGETVEVLPSRPTPAEIS